MSNVVLNWPANPPGDYITDYQVWGDDGTSTAFGSCALLASVGTALTWTDTGIAANQDRTYYVVAVNFYGSSAPSGPFNITTPAASSGDFVGPASATDSNFVAFDGTSGKLGKDSGKSAASFDAAGAAAAALVSAKSYADSGDAATLATAEAYTDTVVNGRSWKNAVRAATTANGTLASAFANGQTIDGVTLATGDRILLKNQTSATENGIYTVNGSGAPTRAVDADAGSELVDASMYVAEGSNLADTQWTCTTNAPITLGVTNLTFVQSGSGATYFADGTTLDLTGTTFSIKSSAPLPGSPTTTTQAGGDNSTKIATTAFVHGEVAAVSIPVAASTTEQLTGTNAAKFATPDSVAALWEKGADTASASLVSLGEGGFFHVTGTTGITALTWATDKAGRCAWVKFDGALTLTHNATSLILPTAANITTVAGDVATFVSEGSGNTRCVNYVRADGTPLALANSGASAGTYGDGTHVPQFSVDAKGRITSVTSVALSGSTGVLLPDAVSLQPWWPPSSAGSLDDEFAAGSTIDTGRWTWVNQGSKTGTIAKSWLALQAVSGGATDNWGLVVQAAPATPWEVVVLLNFHPTVTTNFLYAGVIVRDSGTGKFTNFGFDNANGCLQNNWTNPTTFSAGITSTVWGTYPSGGIGGNRYYKIRDNGTNLIFSISFDGITFIQYNSVGRTSFLASPNQVGLGVGTNIATGTATLDVDFFRRTL